MLIEKRCTPRTSATVMSIFWLPKQTEANQNKRSWVVYEYLGRKIWCSAIECQRLHIRASFKSWQFASYTIRGERFLKNLKKFQLKWVLTSQKQQVPEPTRDFGHFLASKIAKICRCSLITAHNCTWCSYGVLSLFLRFFGGSTYSHR